MTGWCDNMRAREAMVMTTVTLARIEDVVSCCVVEVERVRMAFIHSCAEDDVSRRFRSNATSSERADERESESGAV